MTDKPEPIDVDLGVLEVPQVTKLDDPWIFRGACHLKEPWVTTMAGPEGTVLATLAFGLILDLGFGIYRQIDAMLDGASIVGAARDNLAVAFAENWAANGQPNPLEVCTVEQRHGGAWFVHVYRVELELETLNALGRTSLVDALVEQGLAVKV